MRKIYLGNGIFIEQVNDELVLKALAIRGDATIVFEPESAQKLAEYLTRWLDDRRFESSEKTAMKIEEIVLLIKQEIKKREDKAIAFPSENATSDVWQRLAANATSDVWQRLAANATSDAWQRFAANATSYALQRFAANATSVAWQPFAANATSYALQWFAANATSEAWQWFAANATSEAWKRFAAILEAEDSNK